MCGIKLLLTFRGALSPGVSHHQTGGGQEALPPSLAPPVCKIRSRAAAAVVTNLQETNNTTGMVGEHNCGGDSDTSCSLSLPSAASSLPVNEHELLELVRHRGPDCTTLRTGRVLLRADAEREGSLSSSPAPGNDNDRFCVAQYEAQGSVLSLRGVDICPQPFFGRFGSCGDATGQSDNAKDDDDVSVINKRASAASSTTSTSSSSSSSWLLWNGEVFGGDIKGYDDEACDTPLVFTALKVVEDRRSTEPTHFLQEVRDVLEGIAGPFAFIYFASTIPCIVYGRDPLCRRSLIVHRGLRGEAYGKEEQWIIASVAAPHIESSSCPDALQHGGASQSLQFQLLRGGDDDEEEGDDVPHQDTRDAVTQGCWTEVPSSGVFALSFLPKAKEEEEAAGCAAAAAHFHSVPWKLSHQTHPVLCLPSNRFHYRVSIDHHVALSRRMQQVVKAVGYTWNATVDSSLPCAMEYLLALAQAVETRIRPSHAGGQHSRGGAAAAPAASGDGGTTSSPNPAAPIALLFSGGIDSTILATLVHYIAPLTTPIELVNVSFGSNPSSTPDRIACVMAMKELLALPCLADDDDDDGGEHAGGRPRAREWRLVCVDVPQDQQVAQEPHILNLIYPRSTVMDHNIGCAIWFASRGVGKMMTLLSVSSSSSSCCSSQPTAAPGRGGGQLDKHVRVAAAAALVDTSLVSHPHIDSSTKSSDDGDTIFQPLVDVLISEGLDDTGVCGVKVLLSTLGKEYGAALTPVWKAAGYRKLGNYLNDAAAAGWVFFGDDRSTSKFVMLRRPQDITAAQTALFERSIASLAAFAKHDKEEEEEDDITEPYRCQSKVLLLGMGADETLGGYVRYRRVYQRAAAAAAAVDVVASRGSADAERHGLDAVKKELQRDFSRLWTRNLGRDDRVVADHGREGRFPFLDENVLWTLSRIAAGVVAVALDPAVETEPRPVQEEENDERGRGHGGSMMTSIVDVRLGEGVGDKKLLRTCARLLGLDQVSRLQKRAIQFGTRVANRKLHGSQHVSHALTGGGGCATATTTSVAAKGSSIKRQRSE